MRRERKVNIIRALKDELDFYKRQPVPVKVIERTELNHFRISQVFSQEEISRMPKEILSPLLIQRITKEFADLIGRLPIETEYDEKFGVYRARLDLWVNPNPMDRR